ncbi:MULTISPECIES: BA14K family protein [unclassified Afipia]|uniref:BA14K family protein n=1 Tax=unclassified Afipia TaxID=2642050 RepID=UPI00041980FA|nr:MULTISPECIES: BA14K family protein [unclassified Afipia]MBQ8102088.1 BA14K family protein [Afipia sp.]MBS4004317.1 BA14K family protein [Afipia sp.]WIG51137.1 MAG: hypothetical protein OJF48_002054 [Afipia sp.]
MINLKVFGTAALLAITPVIVASSADAQVRFNGGGASRGGAPAIGGGGGFRGGGAGMARPSFSGGGMAARPNFGGGPRVGNSGIRFSGPPSAVLGNRAISGRPVAQLGGGGQWNGGRHWHGHRPWRGPGYGFGAGLALGAIGSSYYYNDPYYYDNSYAYAPDTYVDDEQYAAAPAADGDAAYCAQRYKSYDPASGTYLNYDGNRYPCP